MISGIVRRFNVINYLSRIFSSIYVWSRPLEVFFIVLLGFVIGEALLCVPSAFIYSLGLECILVC